MKKTGIVIPIVIMLLLSGCAPKNETGNTEIKTGSITVSRDSKNIALDDVEEFVYTSLPYFYKDFYDEEFGDDKICDNGNLVACLSMLESYYLDLQITPDVFVERHSELCDNGCESLNSSEITSFIESLNVGCIEDDFSVKEAVTKLKSLHGYILVYIPHTSIYGKGGSYLIIAGTYDDYFIVHDPSKISENKNKVSETKEKEILYNATQLTLAASNDSKMWIIY